MRLGLAMSLQLDGSLTHASLMQTFLNSTIETCRQLTYGVALTSFSEVGGATEETRWSSWLRRWLCILKAWSWGASALCLFMDQATSLFHTRVSTLRRGCLYLYCAYGPFRAMRAACEGQTACLAARTGMVSPEKAEKSSQLQAARNIQAQIQVRLQVFKRSLLHPSSTCGVLAAVTKCVHWWTCFSLYVIGSCLGDFFVADLVC